MSPFTVTDLAILNDVCKGLLAEPGVRFAGVINQMGNRIAGGFREDITPFVDYNKEHMMYMELVLDLRMRSEFDNELGPVKYNHSKRGRVSMVSIPMEDYIVVLATEVEVNIQRLVGIVEKQFSSKYRKMKTRLVDGTQELY